MVREFDERNMARSRERCAAMAEEADTGKRRLTERERAILDMWPRYEDGELVMVGDRVGHPVEKVGSITILESAFVLCDDAASSVQHERGQCVKRPAPKVLDADGVEIKVGDTVWHHSGFAHGVATSIDAGSLMGTVRYVNGGVEFRDAAKDLTHARPDSWEQLEEDASKEPCFYFGFEDKPCGDGAGCPANKLDNCSKLKASDIIRRAKALAGVEVAG